MNPQKDFEYFLGLWEKRSPEKRSSAESWDVRADAWAKELEENPKQQQAMMKRVGNVAAWLRGRGLLEPGSTAVDVGCGLGRFVAEFAKTVDHATGVDFSQRMVDHGQNYARSQGLKNTSFFTRDFGEVDLDAEGWVGVFDLVFTSITPAVRTMSALEKLNRMSRKYCFSNTFVYGWDELDERIGKSLFGMENNPSPVWDGRWFYSLFNVLWLMGYYPETYYDKETRTSTVKVDRAFADYYARPFATKETLEETTDRVYDYLMTQTDDNGMIEEYSERWYGWMLWDVRVCTDRRAMLPAGESACPRPPKRVSDS